MNDEAWHHHVITYDGSDGRYYLDGELKETMTKVINTSGTTMEFGREFGRSAWYKGKLDDVALWDVVLDSDAISTIYSSGSRGIDLLVASGDYSSNTSSDLLGYWKLDGDVNDYSGNGNNGTANGPVPANAAPTLAAINNIVTNSTTAQTISFTATSSKVVGVCNSSEITTFELGFSLS